MHSSGKLQTIQYILPQDAHRLSHAELLVIDEAAAIPLPMVRMLQKSPLPLTCCAITLFVLHQVEKLMGPYLVFLSSTVNGYEGTGRSLSLKLVKQLRHSSNTVAQNTAGGGA